MIVIINIYTKIPKEIFDTENSIGLIHKTNNDNLVFILYYLYLLTNFENKAVISIKFLCEKIGYFNKKDTRDKIIDTLFVLKQNKMIDFDCINNISDVFEVDTTPLFKDDNFIILEKEEFDKINNSSFSKKEISNLLKVFIYIKSKSYRRLNNEEIYINGGLSQTCYVSYENIAENTTVNKSLIIKYISILQELNLIKYSNLGSKIKNDIVTDCSNIYAITSICKENINIELKEGLKQQRYYYEQLGYKIVKNKLTNNKRKINGRIGYLTKKLKNKTITDNELQELNKLKSL